VRRLLDVVAAFRGRRIVVVGDLVCDEFVHGDIARVSREAPVLILEHARTQVVPGGAGNAVANLRALGASPVPVGVVGADAAGDALLATLRAAGVRTSGIRAERGYGTPTKSRVLAGGVHTRRQQIVRIDRGSRHGELPLGALARLARRLSAALRGADALLVADYGYGAAPPSLLAGLPKGRVPSIVTVDSRERVGAFRRVTACTPNQEEVERALGLAGPPSDRAVPRAARDLLRRTGNEAVLVTRGAKGMVLLERGKGPHAIPAFGAGEVADVTGAGDTVIAVFTLARASGATFLEAAELANVAAGLVVMKYGTATVSPREMTRAIREGDAP
jgi:D-glycero-beta-D-manno-heptose-7-phosphate kinase